MLTGCYTEWPFLISRLNCSMNLSSLKRNPVFYSILLGFVIMVWVILALLNSAIKGKEKDFNDKLFYVVAFYEDQLNRDTAKVRPMQ